MEYMATQPDKAFDLAIVDPPYGREEKTTRKETKLNKSNKFAIKYNGKKWNKAPNQKYFSELFRVSKNQIICGGNYFQLPVSRGWVIWDKIGDNLSVVNNELIWTSFDIQPKTFRRCHGLDKGFMNKEGENIHPTQKPVKLYEWLLWNYANKDMRIFDTHLGSGSSAIAAHYFGCNFVGCEIDPDYYQAAKERFDRQTAQRALFG
jgi:site-specific DNA-methyltransferase (adenine-specific)